MFQCLEFLALTCLFLAAKTITGQILPPQNLSLHWINEFYPELTWELPPHSVENCKCEGYITTNTPITKFNEDIQKASYSERIYMEGGFLHYSLRTVCGDNQSEPAVLSISDPELVMSVDCYSYTLTQGHCSWSPVQNATDLRFFYQLSVNFDKSTPGPLTECSSYNYTGDVKSGCNLRVDSTMSIGMLFNATVNNRVVRNTFNHINLKVKPPAPTWTVEKNKNQFNISWIPSDLLSSDSWKFLITYTKCNKQSTTTIEEATFYVLRRVSDCRYCIWIEARSDFGNSLSSDKKCFDPDPDHLIVVYIVVALIVALALVSIMCFQRNKDYIFPKIPVPSNIFKDVIENNNESFFHKLYIPQEEEENCTVTVVRETQTNKPDC